jgi:hypothetical protein
MSPEQELFRTGGFNLNDVSLLKIIIDESGNTVLSKTNLFSAILLCQITSWHQHISYSRFNI